MKLGGAYYCDDCGGEIQSGGDRCKDCDPINGVQEITYTFIAVRREQTYQEKPLWRRLLGL